MGRPKKAHLTAISNLQNAVVLIERTDQESLLRNYYAKKFSSNKIVQNNHNYSKSTGTDSGNRGNGNIYNIGKCTITLKDIRVKLTILDNNNLNINNKNILVNDLGGSGKDYLVSPTIRVPKFDKDIFINPTASLPKLQENIHVNPAIKLPKFDDNILANPTINLPKFDKRFFVEPIIRLRNIDKNILIPSIRLTHIDKYVSKSIAGKAIEKETSKNSNSDSSSNLSVVSAGEGDSSVRKKILLSSVSVVIEKGDLNMLMQSLKRKISPVEDTVAVPEDDDMLSKRRCLDRYDSSESSDSGVAVSCSEVSSTSSNSSNASTSGSDITEPSSPCSTSSDEGVASLSRNSSISRSISDSSFADNSPRNSPPNCKVVSSAASTSSQSSSSSGIDSTNSSTVSLLGEEEEEEEEESDDSTTVINRIQQWPWTPPLAATACSTLKRTRGEPEAGCLPDPGNTTPRNHQAKGGAGQLFKTIHQESAQGKISDFFKSKSQQLKDPQGKITKYFKAQIKPQQSKSKKSHQHQQQQNTEMSVLAVKSPEFRRPATVHRGGINTPIKTSVSSSNSVFTALLGRSLNSGITEDWGSKTLKHQVDKQVKTGNQGPFNGFVTPDSKISSARLNGSISNSPVVAVAIQQQRNDQERFCEENAVTAKTPQSNGTGNIAECNKVSEVSEVEAAAEIGSSSSKEQSTAWSSHAETKSAVPQDPASSTSLGMAMDEEEEEESSRDSAATTKSSSRSSPILSTPTTIRFPPRDPRTLRAQGSDIGFCRWTNCEINFEGSSALLEHLQVAHINTQTGGDNFVCEWQGCKVQGRSSCSRRWLERHVLSHGGNKPLVCIVEGCGCRFSSQNLLERHVNSHFEPQDNTNSNGKRSLDNGAKLVRRNGKKLRYRTQPWSARSYDYFDSGVMEGLQQRLINLAMSRTQGKVLETPGDSIFLTSQILAKRVEVSDGKTRVLLRWHPKNIEPDQWVLEDEVVSNKYVKLRTALYESPIGLSETLFPAIYGGRYIIGAREKQRRKPVKFNT